VHLPVLARLQNRTLSLSNYRIEQGQCTALAQAATLFENTVCRLRIDNCNLRDLPMAQILNSICNLKKFKSICYRKGEFGEASLLRTKTLLDKSEAIGF